MEVSIIFDICTYCVFTLYGRVSTKRELSIHHLCLLFLPIVGVVFPLPLLDLCSLSLLPRLRLPFALPEDDESFVDNRAVKQKIQISKQANEQPNQASKQAKNQERKDKIKKRK